MYIHFEWRKEEEKTKCKICNYKQSLVFSTLDYTTTRENLGRQKTEGANSCSGTAYAENSGRRGLTNHKHLVIFNGLSAIETFRQIVLTFFAKLRRIIDIFAL